MTIGYSNIAKSSLLEAIDSDDTQVIIQAGGYEGFLRIDADYTYARLANAFQNELVKIDLSNSGPHIKLVAGAVTYSGGLSVARGQGGTQAVSWPRGSLIYIEVTADYLNEIIQRGLFRTIDYNPNGVLSPAYKGEKVYQSNDPRWWKSYNDTDPYWAMICGVAAEGETWRDPGELGWQALMLIVATPVISPVAGSYDNSVEITITCSTSGATIYYTTDGSTPTEASTEYTAPFTIIESATVSAKAFKAGWSDSDVAEVEYVVAGHWVSYFDNTCWETDEYHYGYWDGTKWVAELKSFQGYFVILWIIGSWYLGYRPSKMRITYSPAIPLTVILRYAGQVQAWASGELGYSSGQEVDFVLTEDIGSLYMQGDPVTPIAYSITNIEFYA